MLTSLARLKRPILNYEILQVYGQHQYVEDLEKYLFHYVAQLILNYAAEIDEQSTQSCNSSLKTYVSDISDSVIRDICQNDKNCSSDGPYILHCFL